MVSFTTVPRVIIGFILLLCQVSDWEKLLKTLADALEHYNEVHAVMDLVLFEEAIQHV